MDIWSLDISHNDIQKDIRKKRKENLIRSVDWWSTKFQISYSVEFEISFIITFSPIHSLILDKPVVTGDLWVLIYKFPSNAVLLIICFSLKVIFQIVRPILGCTNYEWVKLRRPCLNWESFVKSDFGKEPTGSMFTLICDTITSFLALHPVGKLTNTNVYIQLISQTN